MKKIQKRLSLIKKQKRMGLMTHVVVGYPDLEKTEEIIMAMDKAGSDFIELQIPFSDPMADGPVILEANRVALENKVHLDDCLRLMKKVSQKTSAALIFMGYLNSILSFGLEKFFTQAKESGAAGVIFPDVPIDSTEKDFYILCEKNDIAPIFVLSPLTTQKRMKEIKKYAKGLVYCVSNFGITGKTKGFHSDLDSYLSNVRKNLALPLAVGWGIKSKEGIDKLKGKAEIAIMGSEVIRKIDSMGENFRANKIESFIKELF